MIYRQTWLGGFFVIQFSCCLWDSAIWACAVLPSGAGQSSFPWLCVYSTWTSLLLASLPHLTHPVLEKGQLSHCCVGKINRFFIAGSQLTVEVTIAGCLLHTKTLLDGGRWLWAPRSGVHRSQGFLVMCPSCAKLCELLSNNDDVFNLPVPDVRVYLFIVSKHVWGNTAFGVFSTFKPCKESILITWLHVCPRSHTLNTHCSSATWENKAYGVETLLRVFSWQAANRGETEAFLTSSHSDSSGPCKKKTSYHFTKRFLRRQPL